MYVIQSEDPGYLAFITAETGKLRLFLFQLFKKETGPTESVCENYRHCLLFVFAYHDFLFSLISLLFFLAMPISPWLQPLRNRLRARPMRPHPHQTFFKEAIPLVGKNAVEIRRQRIPGRLICLLACLSILKVF
jgi:hypothetical protein